MDEADARRMQSGLVAAEVIGEIDAELLAAFDHAVEAMREYGELMARRGMHPGVVLAQMSQVASDVFVQVLLPYIHVERKPADDEH